MDPLRSPCAHSPTTLSRKVTFRSSDASALVARTRSHALALETIVGSFLVGFCAVGKLNCDAQLGSNAS